MVEVPKGQRVNLVLSDGTKVCLNSNSRLHYPAVFSGKQRHVELEGEAFLKSRTMKNVHLLYRFRI